ncbi:MAG: glycosyltransferase [Planctomycetaceae bacterium]|nr:glycosyltransferase [Planctomycetaceae bacterium]
MKIAIVYGNDGSDVRVAKTCATLVKQGHEVHFVGWDRRPMAEKNSVIPGVTSHVIRHPVARLGSTGSGQWAFTQHAVKLIWQLGADVVCAVNEDNLARVGWLRGIAYRKLVCDVFDSHLDKCTERSWPIRAGVWAFVNSSRWWSDRLVATDEHRFETFGPFKPKTIVVGNYPPDPGAEWAEIRPIGPPSLFVSGTLSRLRGIEQTLKAAEQVPGFRILAAGWAADEYAADVFLKHPSVEFLGHVTPRQSLEYGAQCDALLAMYAPISRNQILASPNKIYDAISVGRPVIINSEAVVSQWVTKHEVGFACPYEDHNALAEFFATLAERRNHLEEFATRARQLFLSGYSWEAMEERIAEMYASLDPQSQGDPRTIQVPVASLDEESHNPTRKAA